MRDAIRFPGLCGVRGLRHVVTTRAGGTSDGPFASLNLGRRTGDDPARVDENRRRAGAMVGASRAPLFPRQVHGVRVALVDESSGEDLGEADAVATATPGRPVGVLGADCPGVLVVDPVRRALAVAHAGWRGTAAGVVEATVATLVARLGSRPEDLLVGIGPGISARRYEVGPEVAAAFPSDGDGVLTPGRGDRSHVDLVAAVRRRLVACGVSPSSIEASGGCTYDDAERFFSHRRDGERTGRHALVAVWE